MFSRWLTGSEGQERSPSRWLSAAAVAGLFCVLFAVFFAPVMLGWETFTYLDSGLFAYPVAFHLKESLLRGEFPLWNPYNNCGIPFAAQWNTLACYPLSLFYIVLPMPWAFNVFCLGHLVLGGAGMHFLGKKWTGHSLAAAFAGIIFAFNGLTWYGLMWPHIIAALGWMPWVVAALENALERGGRAIAGASAVAALQMLTGGAEAIIQTWLVVAGLAAFMVFQKRVTALKAMLRLLGCGAAVFCFAAVQLLPFLDLLIHSQRTGDYADATTAAMPAYGWANFILPLFHKVKNAQGIYVPAKLNWTGSYYMGIGTILLAVIAVWKARNTKVWFLSVVSGAGLLLALGSAGMVYSVLEVVVPFLGMVRFPVKYVMLATFALPLLAAFGLSEFLESDGGIGERKLMKTGIALCALIVGLGVIAWVAPHPKEQVSATILNAVSRIAMLGVTVGVLLLLRARGGATGWQLLLLLIAWVDVYTHGSNYSPTAPAAYVEPAATRVLLGWENTLRPGESRAMLSPAAMTKMLTAGSPDAAVDTQGRRLAQFMNFNLLDKVPKLDGLYSLELREYDLVRGVYFARNEPRGLLNFLGVSHVSSATNAIQWVQRDGFLPMVMGGQKIIYATPGESTRMLLGDDFAANEVVLLEPQERDKVGERARTRVRVQTMNFSAHAVKAQFEADADSIITVAQSYYHCWKAYVDGVPVPLLKANVGFQAVAVPAGRHELELRYQDRAFRSGAALSGASWLYCGAAWVWSRRRTRTA